MSRFKKATKKSSRLRMAIAGPAGSGKTYTALKLASSLGRRVAVIDTERGSASKYSDMFDFCVDELETFSPAEYVASITAAEQDGFDVIIVDSLTHAWTGKDGALEMANKEATKSYGNKFAAWRNVTPAHNALVDALLNSRAHIIVTLRTKTEYVMEENAKGKQIPVKVGLAPVQRDGLEYEFDVFGTMTADNELVIGKTRCSALAGQVYSKPGEELAETLLQWLTDGTKEESPNETTIAAMHEARRTTPGRPTTYADMIGNAQTVEELSTVAKQIAQSVGKNSPEREELTKLFLAKRSELANKEQ